MAPECYSNECSPKADVFSLGMILYEMAAGAPAFSNGSNPMMVAKELVIDENRPPIPEGIWRCMKGLITDCWADDPDDRPSFAEIVEWLQEMDFKVVPGVNSAKLSRFLEAITALEAARNDE
jgi:serine/threonine protein kinase